MTTQNNTPAFEYPNQVDDHDMLMRMMYKTDRKSWRDCLKCLLKMSMRTRKEASTFTPGSGSCAELSFKYHTCVAQAIIWALNGRWQILRDNKQKFLEISGALLEKEMEGAMKNDDHTIYICGRRVKGEEAIRRIGITMKGDYETYAEWCLYDTI